MTWNAKVTVPGEISCGSVCWINFTATCQFITPPSCPKKSKQLAAAVEKQFYNHVDVSSRLTSPSPFSIYRKVRVSCLFFFYLRPHIDFFFLRRVQSLTSGEASRRDKSSLEKKNHPVKTVIFHIKAFKRETEMKTAQWC